MARIARARRTGITSRPAVTVATGDYWILAKSFERGLLALNRSPATIRIYTISVDQLGKFLEAPGMPLGLASITRERGAGAPDGSSPPTPRLPRCGRRTSPEGRWQASAVRRRRAMPPGCKVTPDDGEASTARAPPRPGAGVIRTEEGHP